MFPPGWTVVAQNDQDLHRSLQLIQNAAARVVVLVGISWLLTMVRGWWRYFWL